MIRKRPRQPSRGPLEFRDYPLFDPSPLSPSLQEWFTNVHARIQEVAQSLTDAYRPSPGELTIQSCYKHTTSFNACTWSEGDRIVVGMGAAVMILLDMLFVAMLADSRVLPALPAVTQDGSAQATFAVDFRDTERLSNYDGELSAERAAAAHLLADFCVSFVYLHELAHVICGHIGAAHELFDERQFVEFADRAAPVASSSPLKVRVAHRRLRQYWEYQADAVAAMLLIQYVDTAIDRLDVRHGWIRSLVSPIRGVEELRRHLGALAVMSVTAMFVYLEHGRLRAKKTSWHPHSIVRSLYVKDVFAGQAAMQWGCQPRDIGELHFRYLEPFLFALERRGVGSVRKWNPDLLHRFEKEAIRLGHSGPAHREVARPWSWVPVDSWG